MIGWIVWIAKDLITHLLCVDPTQRYSIDEFLAHPWMNVRPTYSLPLPLLLTHSFPQLRRSPPPPQLQHPPPKSTAVQSTRPSSKPSAAAADAKHALPASPRSKKPSTSPTPCIVWRKRVPIVRCTGRGIEDFWRGWMRMMRRRMGRLLWRRWGRNMGPRWNACLTRNGRRQLVYPNQEEDAIEPDAQWETDAQAYEIWAGRRADLGAGMGLVWIWVIQAFWGDGIVGLWSRVRLGGLEAGQGVLVLGGGRMRLSMRRKVR